MALTIGVIPCHIVSSQTQYSAIEIASILLAEQARLKEQAAKEQESTAKSIKDKQQPKDNPNKKSKP